MLATGHGVYKLVRRSFPILGHNDTFSSQNHRVTERGGDQILGIGFQPVSFFQDSFP
jgi:hypothetical protein